MKKIIGISVLACSLCAGLFVIYDIVHTIKEIGKTLLDDTEDDEWE